ncbi:ANTAR domain-containing protein, partial [Escherichia coli]
MNEMSRKPSPSRDVGGRKTMVQELADLSAVVVAPVDDQIGMLLRELQRFRMRVRQVWP